LSTPPPVSQETTPRANASAAAGCLVAFLILAAILGGYLLVRSARGCSDGRAYSKSVTVATFSGGISSDESGESPVFHLQGGKQWLSVTMTKEGEGANFVATVYRASGITASDPLTYNVDFSDDRAGLELGPGDYSVSWESVDCDWTMRVSESRQ
jgi:hypothetical protein